LVRNVQSTVVVVGCVALGFLASAGPGIVARAAEPVRWAEPLIVPGAEQHRVAQLGPQPKALEAARSETSPAPLAAPLAEELAERDALVARNQELVAHNQALALQNQALAQSQAAAARGEACAPPPAGVDPKEQLRYWGERLRSGDYGFRGGLSPEQMAALNVLMRRERPLDPRNPWR
jgi:hypothetical protein